VSGTRDDESSGIPSRAVRCESDRLPEFVGDCVIGGTKYQFRPSHEQARGAGHKPGAARSNDPSGDFPFAPARD